MIELNETEKKIILAMRDAVLNKGADYVYEAPRINDNEALSCFYVVNGEASCLVGHGLINSKIMDADHIVEKWQGAGTSMEAYQVFAGDKQLDDVRLDVAHSIAKAQDVQDFGHTWGQAYDVMINTLECHEFDTTGLEVDAGK